MCIGCSLKSSFSCFVKNARDWVEDDVRVISGEKSLAWELGKCTEFGGLQTCCKCRDEDRLGQMIILVWVDKDLVLLYHVEHLLQRLRWGGRVNKWAVFDSLP